MTCCEIPTPDSILDDTQRDVFEDIIPDTYAGYQVMRQIMWDTYGSRGIGHCDVDYWVKEMQRRFRMIYPTYSVKFKAFNEWLTANTGNDPVDLSDATTHYSTVYEHEDNPDNPQGDTRYLADRDTTTYDGKNYGGLSSETLARFMDAVPDLCQEFADEFRKMFYFGV